MVKNKKKVFLVTICLVATIVLVYGAALVQMWGNEISSILSFRELEQANTENRSAPVYLMDIRGDIYFDDFLEQGGASNDQELIQFVVDHITKGLIPVSISTSDIGCSSFTALGRNDHRYFGRNYDFSTTSSMIVRTNPGNGRYASVSSVDLQFLGFKNGQPVESLMDKITSLAAAYAPLDGINEAGVACGIYMSFQGGEKTVATDQDTEKPDLTSSTMLRMILDYAGSVDEAVKLVEQYDLHDSANTSFHYMVADSSGRSAILEWVNGDDVTDTDGSKRELKVYYNDADQHVGHKEGKDNFQYVTNFLVTPDYYTQAENKTGLDRYQEIQKRINPEGDNPDGLFEREQSLDLLETLGRRKWDAAKGKDDSDTITVWSALYDLTDKKVTWISNEQFHDPSSVFTFDFSYLN